MSRASNDQASTVLAAGPESDKGIDWAWKMLALAEPDANILSNWLMPSSPQMDTLDLEQFDLASDDPILAGLNLPFDPPSDWTLPPLSAFRSIPATTTSNRSSFSHPGQAIPQAAQTKSSTDSASETTMTIKTERSTDDSVLSQRSLTTTTASSHTTGPSILPPTSKSQQQQQQQQQQHHGSTTSQAHATYPSHQQLPFPGLPSFTQLQYPQHYQQQYQQFAMGHTSKPSAMSQAQTTPSQYSHQQHAQQTMPPQSLTQQSPQQTQQQSQASTTKNDLFPSAGSPSVPPHASQQMRTPGGIGGLGHAASTGFGGNSSSFASASGLPMFNPTQPLQSQAFFHSNAPRFFPTLSASDDMTGMTLTPPPPMSGKDLTAAVKSALGTPQPGTSPKAARPGQLPSMQSTTPSNSGRTGPSSPPGKRSRQELPAPLRMPEPSIATSRLSDPLDDSLSDDALPGMPRTSRSGVDPNDKRERNKVAAERYRIKKRLMQQSANQQLSDLKIENNALKARIVELENEVRALRSRVPPGSLLSQ